MERWLDEIEGWESRPVAAGFEGLRSLAADEFSGAVSAGDSWLFLVNGRGVGVFEYAGETAAAPPTVSRGSLGAFDGADLTARAAPHHSIPLLIAMQAGETTPRARYYTEDTPIPEVHETLTDGGFTGYLELSENVLSGDYYVVYQAGRAANVAFIGNSRRVETGDDAFERACDEVGIYEVVAASIEPVDLPEPQPAPEPEPDPDTDPDPDPDSGIGAVAADDPADESAADGSAGEDDATTVAGRSRTSDSTAASAETGSVTDESSGSADAPDALGSLDSLDVTGTSDTADGTGTDAADGSDRPDGPGSAGARGADADDGDHGDDPGTEPTDTDRDDLVPAITEVDAADSPAAGADDAAGASRADAGAVEDRPGTVTDVDADASAAASTPSGGAGPERTEAAATDPADSADSAGAATDAERAAALRDRLAEREAELDALRSERDELAARVSELEATVEELRGGGAAAAGTTSAGERLSAADALAGTNLFIRYRSKGAATLSDAVGGDATREELADNLRIEHHTGFDAAEATVDGEPFETWLAGTHQFRFLRWLVTALPFEIRETRSQEALADLYAALPEIDRVELDGSVPTDEETSVAFDLVALDQMGDPLLVAEIDPDREPIAETGVADLVRSATSVATATPELAAAFHVTEAFFRPRAMEAAREATSGSLLSRDSRRSFVKISRNRGYHLCLVEARDDSYYLSVPDL